MRPLFAQEAHFAILPVKLPRADAGEMIYTLTLKNYRRMAKYDI